LEAKTNYTIVGLVVLMLIGALIGTALWLSVGFDQKKHNTYVVYMHEAVSGLSEQSAVKYNGVKVGFVSKIELNRQDPQQVKIFLNIEEGTPITTSTSATLISQGITGTTFVGLAAGSSDLTPLQQKPNEPYPVIKAKPSLFYQLDRVLKEVSESVNKVSQQVGRVFDSENTANLKKTLVNIKGFTDVLSKNNQEINRSLQNIDSFLRQLPELGHDLKTGVHKFNDMATSVSGAGKSVSEMATSLSAAGKSVSGAMDAGKTTIDKISQETIPSTAALMQRLNTIAINLEKISSQIRQNPSIVIRGTTPPPLGPGE
jgi:phospholipid/cholesterol/gamma-HCH transport system substrate-binding protein